MKTVEDSDFDIPDSLLYILREYQKRGFLWIKTLKHNGFGGILADDMGLGKSLQVICFLLSEYLEVNPNENRKALIVCPSSLVYNWNSEIQKFAPELPVKMVIGTTNERHNMLQSLEEGDILITSYDLLKRDISYYETIEFYTQVIDEAQYIKNSNTQAAKAVKMINAGFKLALTGTPIENRLSELWSIFDYLMPGFLYSYQRFREEIEIPIMTNQEETVVKRLQKMITPFVLRRLKKEVLTDLPDKLEESIFTQLEGEQQKLYDAHVKRLQIMLDKSSEKDFNTSKIQILSELTKLRQICCDPALLYENYTQGSTKIDMCMDLIQNAISSGHKILLFSQFTSLLDNLQKRLVKEQISFYTLTGATSKENRAKMVEQFNKDDIPVFCISLKAGGTGLNLTAADIVIHFDPWWNVAVQNQATDRAHRIGQKNVVNVYKLIAKGTIEENIMKIQEKKKELADQVLSGEGMNIGSFTKEDLLELLK
jgi:SNF2 family DNA or RNA helicase